MLSKIDPMIYRLHACTPEYKDKHARLFGELRRQLSDACYVSFSAGKDSTVCAHACNLVRPGIPILLVDPGCPTHWLESEREQWQKYADSHIWSYHRFPWMKWKKSTTDLAGDVAAYRKAVHMSMFSSLEAWANSHGCTRRVWGIRKDESPARETIASLDGGKNQKRFAPIRDWTTDDVWAYLVTHELPWLSIYDNLGPDARNGLIGINGSQNGRLVFLKKYYPDAFRVARELFNADDLR